MRVTTKTFVGLPAFHATAAPRFVATATTAINMHEQDSRIEFSSRIGLLLSLFLSLLRVGRDNFALVLEGCRAGVAAAFGVLYSVLSCTSQCLSML